MTTEKTKTIIATIIAAALFVAALTSCKDTQGGHTAPTRTQTQAADTTPTHTPEGTPAGTTAAENPGESAEPTVPPDTWEPDELEVAYIAKTIYGEAGVVPSKARQAAVGWCILNRVDSPGFPDTVAEVVTARFQFAGYHAEAEPPEKYFELARDILTRHHREQQGEADVGRTLPKGWCFFTGDGRENHFTEEWCGTVTWDWSLPDPYSD